MFRRRNPKDSSDQENKPMGRNRDEPELEKGDIPAMLMAAFLVYLPVTIVVAGIIFGVLWFFFFR